MAAHPIRAKLQPYKVLVNLLYGNHPWLYRIHGGTVGLNTGPMSRAMLISVGRLNEYLRHLESLGFFKIVSSSTGKRVLQMKAPPTLQFSPLSSSNDQEGPKSSHGCVECTCECPGKGQPEGAL